MGRPRKFSYAIMAQLIHRLKCGQTIKTACLQVGISTPTYHKWLRDIPVFARRIEQENNLRQSEVESRLAGKVEEGDLGSILHFLSTRDNGRKVRAPIERVLSAAWERMSEIGLSSLTVAMAASLQILRLFERMTIDEILEESRLKERSYDPEHIFKLLENNYPAAQIERVRQAYDLSLGIIGFLLSLEDADSYLERYANLLFYSPLCKTRDHDVQCSSQTENPAAL